MSAPPDTEPNKCPGCICHAFPDLKRVDPTAPCVQCGCEPEAKAMTEPTASKGALFFVASAVALALWLMWRSAQQMGGHL